MDYKKSYARMRIAYLNGVLLLAPSPLRRVHLVTRPAFKF